MRDRRTNEGPISGVIDRSLHVHICELFAWVLGPELRLPGMLALTRVFVPAVLALRCS